MKTEKLTNSQIDEIEQRMNVELPGLYRKILVEIGHGTFGDSEEKRKEIYHPEKVFETYQAFFDEPKMIFAPYFPFGCNYWTQDVWIIEKDEEQAATIPHETVPDDWPDENWINYEDWITENLKAEV